ncbi:MAG: ROK family protein [Pseudomonadota bacterium]
MNQTYLGLDLGGTNIKYGLITADGEILKRGRFKAARTRGPEPIIKDLIEHLRRLVDELPRELYPLGLAVGTAGVIQPRQGILVSAPNLPGWKNIPLAEILAEALDMEVRVENDANLYTLGEWIAGAGRQMDNLVGVTLGTGVGGGLILDGRLWDGSFLSAAEIGHLMIDPQGPPCACGGNGCLETFASATAITRNARNWIREGRECSYTGRLDKLTCARLHQLALQGDGVALEAFALAGWALGIALTSVFNLLGLEGAVIGGGAATAFEFIYPRLSAEFSARTLTVEPEKVKIIPAQLGDDAPLAGAPVLFGAGGAFW